MAVYVSVGVRIEVGVEGYHRHKDPNYKSISVGVRDHPDYER